VALDALEKEVIVIREDFKKLIPALTGEEYKQLEANILSEGIRDPLVVWNGYLVDGHNRYAIANKYSLEYKTVSKEFKDGNEAKLWMILNQFGRRNLNSYQRGELALELESVFSERAKQSQIEGGKNKVVQKSEQAPMERKVITQLAKIANVSHDTIAKVKVIQAIATPEVKAQLSTGVISINQAYQEIKKEEKEQLKTQKAIEIIEKVYESNCNIYHGDCLEYIKTIADKSIDCLITDPPYGVDIQFGAYDNQLSRKIANDENSQDALCLLDKMLIEVKCKLKDNAHLYIFCNWKIYPDFSKIISNHFQIKNVIIWDKLFMGMGDLKGNYSSSYEMIIFAGGNREFLNRPKNIIQCRFNDERFHNTQKPIDLIKQLIENSTDVNELVFDPFLGSGSTVVASKQLKRNYIGCEIDEQNYKITLKRIQDLDNDL
jgi:DNA modification methylase/ParB-like chromosome segregation protein Spo0J